MCCSRFPSKLGCSARLTLTCFLMVGGALLQLQEHHVPPWGMPRKQGFLPQNLRPNWTWSKWQRNTVLTVLIIWSGMYMYCMYWYRILTRTVPHWHEGSVNTNSGPDWSTWHSQGGIDHLSCAHGRLSSFFCFPRHAQVWEVRLGAFGLTCFSQSASTLCPISLPLSLMQSLAHVVTFCHDEQQRTQFTLSVSPIPLPHGEGVGFDPPHQCFSRHYSSMQWMKKIFTGREAVPYKAYQSPTPKSTKTSRHQKTSEDIRRHQSRLSPPDARGLRAGLLCPVRQLIGPAYPCSVSSRVINRLTSFKLHIAWPHSMTGDMISSFIHTFIYPYSSVVIQHSSPETNGQAPGGWCQCWMLPALWPGNEGVSALNRTQHAAQLDCILLYQHNILHPYIITFIQCYIYI